MKKKPVLSIFADGVRFDSLQFMPFLNSLNKAPLETVLGYSITCHPSMYTGVYPDKHKIVFHWVESKKKNGDINPKEEQLLNEIIAYAKKVTSDSRIKLLKLILIMMRVNSLLKTFAHLLLKGL